MRRTPDYLERAVAYRNRAEECRVMAADFRDEGRRTVLESLADDYDRMAKQMEGVLKTRQTLKA